MIISNECLPLSTNLIFSTIEAIELLKSNSKRLRAENASVFPIISISRDFIVDESMRRTESLARLLVQNNREYLITNNEINVSVSIVQNEPGVDKAFIIAANDGHIIAPINKPPADPP